MPTELLKKIFCQIEDPVTATSFGLANHEFRDIFNTFRDDVFPEIEFPLDIATVHMLKNKSQVRLRAVLSSWFPPTLFWDPSRSRFVPLEYFKDVVADMLDVIQEDRDTRAANIRKRRYEKEARQEERAEYKKEKQRRKAHLVEAWKQSLLEENGGIDDILESEPSDFDLSSDEDTESGLDMNLDSDVDQLNYEPDWEALGVPEPSLEDWIKMSKKGGEEKATKANGRQGKKGGKPKLTKAPGGQVQKGDRGQV